MIDGEPISSYQFILLYFTAVTSISIDNTLPTQFSNYFYSYFIFLLYSFIPNAYIQLKTEPCVINQTLSNILLKSTILVYRHFSHESVRNVYL